MYLANWSSRLGEKWPPSGANEAAPVADQHVAGVFGGAGGEGVCRAHVPSVGDAGDNRASPLSSSLHGTLPARAGLEHSAVAFSGVQLTGPASAGEGPGGRSCCCTGATVLGPSVACSGMPKIRAGSGCDEL